LASKRAIGGKAGEEEDTGEEKGKKSDKTFGPQPKKPPAFKGGEDREMSTRVPAQFHETQGCNLKMEKGVEKHAKPPPEWNQQKK